MKNTFKMLVITMLFTVLSIAQTKWVIDNSHSMINFTVAHLMITEVTGQFKDFHGTMTASKQDFTDAKIDVEIKAKSIDTGTERRDNHLRSSDFFNADVDSIITFTSKKMEKTGNDTYKLHGSLTMRGVTKEVVLQTTLKGTANTGRSNVAAFKATTTIPRKEWGLTWNRTIEAGGVTVGENVDLTILIQFRESTS